VSAQMQTYVRGAAKDATVGADLCVCPGRAHTHLAVVQV